MKSSQFGKILEGSAEHAFTKDSQIIPGSDINSLYKKSFDVPMQHESGLPIRYLNHWLFISTMNNKSTYSSLLDVFTGVDAQSYVVMIGKKFKPCDIFMGTIGWLSH